MASKRYLPSLFAKSLWLAMSVFFLVICSCPVKKYIRLQLYKHSPVTEKSAHPDHIKVKDVKDCSIAEKLEQSGFVALSVFSFTGDDFAPLLSLALFSVAALIFIRRNERTTILFKPAVPAPRGVPLYLRVRHLQI